MFKEPLQLEITHYKRYTTQNDIIWNNELIVPKGFVFDVTIPKAIWFILNGLMFSKVVRAVAVHDYEYTLKRKDRYLVDKQLREMLIADKVEMTLAYIAFFGARAVGWYFWRKA